MSLCCKWKEFWAISNHEIIHLCVWWVTKSFELIKVPEVCFPGGGAPRAPPHVKCTKKSLCQIGLKILQKCKKFFHNIINDFCKCQSFQSCQLLCLSLGQSMCHVRDWRRTSDVVSEQQVLIMRHNSVNSSVNDKNVVQNNAVDFDHQSQSVLSR